MMNTKPVLLTALYSVNSRFGFELRLRGHNAKDVDLTVMYEHATDVVSLELQGDETTETLEVHDGETMTIIARHNEMIVACGIFEINTNLPSEINALLNPVVCHNLYLDQHDGVIVEFAPLKKFVEVRQVVNGQLMEVAL